MCLEALVGSAKEQQEHIDACLAVAWASDEEDGQDALRGASEAGEESMRVTEREDMSEEQASAFGKAWREGGNMSLQDEGAALQSCQQQPMQWQPYAHSTQHVQRMHGESNHMQSERSQQTMPSRKRPRTLAGYINGPLEGRGVHGSGAAASKGAAATAPEGGALAEARGPLQGAGFEVCWDEQGASEMESEAITGPSLAAGVGGLQLQPLCLLPQEQVLPPPSGLLKRPEVDVPFCWRVWQAQLQGGACPLPLVEW